MNNTKNIRPTALDEIVTFLKAQPGSRPQAIADAVGVSRQYVQKMLQDKETFDAYGSGPNRFYRLASVMPEDNVTEEMVGHRLGEFSPTRKFTRHGGKMQKELEQKKKEAEITAAKSAKEAPAAKAKK